MSRVKILEKSSKLWKLARSVGWVALAFSLICATPYLRQKIFVTHESAAMALSQLDSNDWGPQIVECINLETAVSRWWNEVDAVELTAHQNHGGDWDEELYVISGLSGWHVTWIVAIPLTATPVTAYDMIGVGDGSMWSRQVPQRIVAALVRCGVVYESEWNRDPPPGF